MSRLSDLNLAPAANLWQALLDAWKKALYHASKYFAYLLWAYVGYTTWAVIVHLAIFKWLWPSYIKVGFGYAPPSPVGAWVFVALMVSLRLWWIGSWSTGYFRTLYPKRRRMPPSPKMVMQSDNLFEMSWVVSGSSIPAVRARYCPRCQAPRVWLGDRMYHCSHLVRQGREGHLPMYDHFCSWLRVSVFLDTIKTHVLTIVGLTLDAVATLITSIYAMITDRQSPTIVYGAACVFASLILLALVLLQAWSLVPDLTWRNQLSAETPGGGVKMALRIRMRDRDLFHFSVFPGNPWDLGPWRNLTEALGPVWQWLNFWYRPRRVFDYGKYPGGRSDLPMSDAFRLWEIRVREGIERQSSGAGLRRRRDAATSSFSDPPDAGAEISPV